MTRSCLGKRSSHSSGCQPSTIGSGKECLLDISYDSLTMMPNGTWPVISIPAGRLPNHRSDPEPPLSPHPLRPADLAAPMPSEPWWNASMASYALPMLAPMSPRISCRCRTASLYIYMPCMCLNQSIYSLESCIQLTSPPLPLCLSDPRQCPGGSGRNLSDIPSHLHPRHGHGTFHDPILRGSDTLFGHPRIVLSSQDEEREDDSGHDHPGDA